jgi:hypothetical protein
MKCSYISGLLGNFGTLSLLVQPSFSQSLSYKLMRADIQIHNRLISLAIPSVQIPIGTCSLLIKHFRTNIPISTISGVRPSLLHISHLKPNQDGNHWSDLPKKWDDVASNLFPPLSPWEEFPEQPLIKLPITRCPLRNLILFPCQHGSLGGGCSWENPPSSETAETQYHRISKMACLLHIPDTPAPFTGQSELSERYNL